jgi:DNA-binding response OmpR family regulator
MEKIIVVEDNEAIREAVTSYLRLDNYDVYEFGKVSGVLEAVKMKNPSLMILDVMLPDGNGFQLAKKIRSISDVPIIFLTAKTSESDRITGFEIGGDDYMVKPFSPKELTLRVKSILKRSVKKDRGKEHAGVWKLGDDVLTIDSFAHRARVNNRELNLTTAEWKILWALARSPGIVYSRDRLLGECLDYMAEGSERTIDTHVKNLRAKLGSSKWIETVRGWGYRFSGKPQGNSSS